MMGNMMGFRPLGYADGDLVMDEQSRISLIEYLMDMTGMGAGTFVSLTNAQLENARKKVQEDALAAQTQQMQQLAPVQGPAGLLAPTQQVAPMQTMPDPIGVPPEGGDQMLIPPVGTGIPMQMARGGIMSLGRR
tara:strand:- start:2689 stop:3090 length:402 start_codon:yes stop_codon:yes gene_type:complete